MTSVNLLIAWWALACNILPSLLWFSNPKRCGLSNSKVFRDMEKSTMPQDVFHSLPTIEKCWLRLLFATLMILTLLKYTCPQIRPCHTSDVIVQHSLPGSCHCSHCGLFTALNIPSIIPFQGICPDFVNFALDKIISHKYLSSVSYFIWVSAQILLHQAMLLGRMV